MKRSKYSLLIQWSEENNCYVVTTPEWTNFLGPITDGKTYKQAAKKGKIALKNMIAFTKERGEPLPEPHMFHMPD